VLDLLDQLDRQVHGELLDILTHAHMLAYEQAIINDRDTSRQRVGCGPPRRHQRTPW
jgi:hypothetical protein